ncbi:MAG: TetR/AcrR family transcriptional regulator [Clostridiales bacterium]|jgi:AcrR family transcriptional regulator|nr:TetR/AcrR family transcriptional regulator [Clostridiales bacterium]
MKDGTNTRDRILQAALEVFTHQGYEGARMEKIASMVGINKASLYFHFKSKEDIFRELFHDIYEKYQNMLATVINESEGLTCSERLNMIYKRYLDYNLNNIEMSFWNRIYYAAPEFMRDDIIEVTGDSKTTFINGISIIMEEGINKKELKPMNPDSMAMTYYYVITCIDLSSDLMNKENAIHEMDQCFEVIWKGIKA